MQTNPREQKRKQTRGISGANFSSIKEGRRGEEAGNISRCSVVFLYHCYFKGIPLYSLNGDHQEDLGKMAIIPINI